MADNIELDAGSGGSNLATDDVGGVHYQIGKLAYGALDSATLAASGAGNVSAGVPRVTLAADDPAVVDLAAIEVLLTTIAGDTTAIETAVEGTLVVDGSGVTQPVTHAALTELGGAINASAQVDVNIAAQAANITVDLGATDNAVLDAIETATEATQAALETVGGLVVNLGANNDVTVTGTVDLGATDNAVLDAIAASLALLDNSIAAGNELQVDVVAALPAGDNNIGNVDIASAIPAGTNNIGDVDVLTIAAGTNAIGNVGLVGRTTGGMSAFNSIDLDESEEEIKGTAGQVFSISAFNTTAAPLWLRFYNATAANTTVGTTAAHLGPFMVPANADSDGAGFIWNNPIGVAFGTAISAAVTTGVAANDTGAPGANACVVVVGYV